MVVPSASAVSRFQFRGLTVLPFWIYVRFVMFPAFRLAVFANVSFRHLCFPYNNDNNNNNYYYYCYHYYYVYVCYYHYGPR